MFSAAVLSNPSLFTFDLITVIEPNIIIKIDIAMMNLPIIFLSLLLKIKNNIDKIPNIIIPSALTKVDNAIIPNEKYVNFLFSLKNKDKALITRIMYSGSVNPKREFCIKCGSKANNAAPINE